MTTKQTRKHRGSAAEEPERAVKRSVTVRRDLDNAIVESVGDRKYSAFVNDALVLALQAQGVGESIADYERENGPLSEALLRAAHQRRARATANAK